MSVGLSAAFDFLEEEISALRVQYVTVPIPPNDKINNRLNKEAFALISLR